MLFQPMSGNYNNDIPYFVREFCYPPRAVGFECVLYRFQKSSVKKLSVRCLVLERLLKSEHSQSNALSKNLLLLLDYDSD